MTSRTRAELYLLSITLIWGSTFAITKSALESVSPFLYTSIRFSCAALLLGAISYRQVLSISRSVLLKGGILGMLLFVGFALQTQGLQFTTASKSAYITGLLVVLTPICQILIERRPPKFGNMIGVLLVTAGLYFLTSPRGSEFNTGDMLTLGCAICFALYIVYLDIFSKDHDAVHLTFAQFAVCATAGLICFLLFEEKRWIPGASLYAALAYLSVFATVIALFVQTKYQKETTPTRAAIIFAVEPVFAAVFAYFVLGEILGTLGIMGGGLIIAGVVVSELSDILFKTHREQPTVHSDQKRENG